MPTKTYLTGMDETTYEPLNLDPQSRLVVHLVGNSTVWQNETLFDNQTTPFPIDDDKEPVSSHALWVQILITIGVLLLVIGTIIGNSLVCIAVAVVKRLQTPSNLLILSLAVSDLLVAVLVMPFAATAEVMTYWALGDVVCDIYTSLDVILCTASILNLCMISVDRYFVITRPFKYAMKRTPKRMGIMIAGVWISSALISIPPLLGWKTVAPKWQCIISQAIGYQIYATLCAFYIPLVAMIVIYYRIWRVSSRLAKTKSQPGSIDRGQDTLFLPSSKSSRSSGQSDHFHPNGILKNGGHDKDDKDESAMEMLPNHRNNNKRRFTIKSLLSRSNKVSSYKEHRATKTLGVIMGGFTACWLPFFILAVIRPFCEVEGHECSIPVWIIGMFQWLGYFNSFMNPVIYVRFNREFRTPFKEILCLRCRGINSRIRSESYVEQYGPDPTFRDSLRPTTDTIVRYNSQGQTIVHLGNGNAKPENESNI